MIPSRTDGRRAEQHCCRNPAKSAIRSKMLFARRYHGRRQEQMRRDMTRLLWELSADTEVEEKNSSVQRRPTGRRRTMRYGMIAKRARKPPAFSGRLRPTDGRIRAVLMEPTWVV